MPDAEACNFIKKETLAQVSCEFYEIFKNVFYYGTPSVAVSGFSKNDLMNNLFSRNIALSKDFTKIRKTNEKS